MRLVGTTTNNKEVTYNNEKLTLDEAYDVYKGVLNDVYPQTEVAPTNEVIVND